MGIMEYSLLGKAGFVSSTVGLRPSLRTSTGFHEHSGVCCVFAQYRGLNN